MSFEDDFKLSGVQPTDPSQPVGPKELAQPGDPAEFRRLLEQLQKLADQQVEEPEVEDVDQLAEHMRRAEDEFRAVMDLRKQLEDAYQRRLP